jgi:hypothetical protein
MSFFFGADRVLHDSHDISNFVKSFINPSSEWYPADVNELPYDKPGLLRAYMDAKTKRNSEFLLTRFD